MKKLIYMLGILCIANNLHAQYIPSPLTTGTNYGVNELLVDTTTNTLFVGGDFTIAGDKTVESSAIWNGSSWEIPAFRAGGIANGYYKGELYTSGPGGAGYFQAGIPPIQCCFAPIMKQELGTNNWIPIGQDIANGWGGEMYDMEVEGDTMYLFGSFTKIGNTSVRHIAKFDGQNFYAIPPPDTSLGATIMCAKFYNGELYVGGNFHGTSDPTIWDIAKWNGHSWENLGSPLTGFMTVVGRMEIYNGELVVLGGFNKAQGDRADGIMSWDGAQWKELGTGMKIDGVDMMLHNGELYVTGKINNSTTPIHQVAKWNGSTWSGIGIDTLSNGTNTAPFPGLVRAITVWNGDFYLGGGFTQINGVACKNIARYSNTTGVFSPVLPQSNITIYPNPAQSTVNISSPDIAFQQISICNALGQILQDHHYISPTQAATLSLAELPKGLYFLKVYTHKGVESVKLLH